MEIEVRSALTGEILASVCVAAETTLQQLEEEAARAKGLDLGRHQLSLMLPDIDAFSTMTVSEVGLHDGSEVHATVISAEEVSAAVESPWPKPCHTHWECFEPLNDYWRLDWIDSRAERIRERTGCGNCRIETQEDSYEDDAEAWRAVHFFGVPAAVSQAQSAMLELAKEGYTSLLWDTFSLHHLVVRIETLRRLIRQGDRTLKVLFANIEQEFDVTVVICLGDMGDRKKAIRHAIFLQELVYDEEPRPRNETCKIKVAGSASGVPQAIGILKELFMYYCTELTHPGLVHEEVILPFQMHRCEMMQCFSQGELRHIQKNWRVWVHSPLDYLQNDDFVIVGEPADVLKAKAYMEKVGIAAGEHMRRCQRLGRDAVENWGISDEADDFWGEEREEDAWMSSYMYRRTDVAVS